MDERPRFTHACNACQFLGCFTYEVDDRRWDVDLYACPRLATERLEYDRTIIARFGSDGPEYASLSVEDIRCRPADLRPSTWSLGLQEGVRRIDELTKPRPSRAA